MSGCPSRSRTWTPFRAPEPKSGVPTNFTKGQHCPIREFAPEGSNLGFRSQSPLSYH